MLLASCVNTHFCSVFHNLVCLKQGAPRLVWTGPQVVKTVLSSTKLVNFDNRTDSIHTRRTTPQLSRQTFKMLVQIQRRVTERSHAPFTPSSDSVCVLFYMYVQVCLIYTSPNPLYFDTKVSYSAAQSTSQQPLSSVYPHLPGYQCPHHVLSQRATPILGLVVFIMPI